MVKRVELGGSRPSGETPAQRDPRLRRRARRLPAPALGALAALMAVAAGWPGVASAAAVHSVPPAPAIQSGRRVRRGSPVVRAVDDASIT